MDVYVNIRVDIRILVLIRLKIRMVRSIFCNVDFSPPWMQTCGILLNPVASFYLSPLYLSAYLSTNAFLCLLIHLGMSFFHSNIVNMQHFNYVKMYKHKSLSYD